MRFQGKNILVTGGTSGIGLATAKALAKQGARLVVTGRDSARVAQTQHELGSAHLAIASDTSRVTDIDRLAKAVHSHCTVLHGVFANAGIGHFGPVQEMSESQFDETFAVNVKGPFFTIQKMLPFMANPSAVVLNASVHAHLGSGTAALYAASKAAVVSLSRTLACDFAARGIRVNVVTPGPVDTPIFERTTGSKAQARLVTDFLARQTALQRMAKPEEIASAVMFLLSEEASYVTSAEIIVDGGFTYASPVRQSG